MKRIHYIILFAAAGLIYLFCFARCKRGTGGSGGGSGGNIGGGDISKAEMIAKLEAEFTSLKERLSPVMAKMQELSSQMKEALAAKNYTLLQQLKSQLQQLIAENKPLKDRIDAIVAQLLSLGVDVREN